MNLHNLAFQALFIMAILKWCIVLLAVLQFGFMAFDGGRALVKGDYIRPQTGAHAGQLGPWSKIVSSVGIDPEGQLMKLVFVLWGITGLVLTYRFAKDPQDGLMPLLLLDVCSLWYLMVGTFSSAIQIIVLLILRAKMNR
jgi:hypothetical protein